jgi:hypothetical protein
MTDSGDVRWLGAPLIVMTGGVVAAALVSSALAGMFGAGPRAGAALLRARTRRLLILLAALAFLLGAARMAWLAIEISAKPVIDEPFDPGGHEVPRGAYVALTRDGAAG